MTRYRRVLAGAAFALLLGATVPLAKGQKGSDTQIQADAQKQLSNKKFSGVHIQVQNGVVHLTGQVNRFADKDDAQKRVEKIHEGSSILNDITVAGAGSISDADLFQKLSKQLVYDRQGYASYPFNSLTLQIQNGVATIAGSSYNRSTRTPRWASSRTHLASPELWTIFRSRRFHRQTIASVLRSITPSMATLSSPSMRSVLRSRFA